jgi:uncharacterized membrane protein
MDRNLSRRPEVDYGQWLLAKMALYLLLAIHIPKRYILSSGTVNSSSTRPGVQWGRK